MCYKIIEYLKIQELMQLFCTIVYVVNIKLADC